jgi:hypothetical protein
MSKDLTSITAQAVACIGKGKVQEGVALLDRVYEFLYHYDGRESLYHPKKAFFDAYMLLIGVSPDHKARYELIIQYGVPRSGSTLIWQICDAIYPGLVIKTHDAVDTGGKSILSVRDPRDTLVSRWQIRLAKQGLSAAPKMTNGQIIGGADVIKRDLGKLMAFIAAQDDPERMLIIRYEIAFFEGNLKLIRQLKKFLNVDLSRGQEEEFAGKFSIANNKKISEQLASFDEYDDKSHIHGNHINGARPGKWRDFITLPQQHIVEKLFKEELIFFGYR